MTPRTSILVLTFFLVALVAASFPCTAQTSYDSNPAWPLCGNYYLTAPSTWDPAVTGCPDTRWGMPDLINDTYGPRLRSGKYDWHRGLDLHTDGEDGRPTFAITCGKVKTVDDVYNGTVVVEHYPNYTCKTDGTDDVFPRCHKIGGCYYARYRHLASVEVDEGDLVTKGQLVGTTGRNVDSTTDPDWADAYPHLHFEIRDYQGGPNYYARGQREAIHPLKVLPYDDTGADGIVLTITDFTSSSTGSSSAEVLASMANDFEELDLVRVDLALYVNGTLVPWTNSGASYTTPDGEAYALDPPFFDMQLWSRQFNYTDTSKVPYEDFLPASMRSDSVDGPWLSPYADPSSSYHQASFPSSHDDDWHMEARQSFPNEHIGDFNGLEVEPENFNRTYAFYDLTLRFEELPSVASGATVCLKAWGTDVLGNTSDPDDATWGDCSTVP